MRGLGGGIQWQRNYVGGGGYRLAYIHLIEHYKIIEHVIHNISLPG